MSAQVHLLLVRHAETVWNQENRWQGHADTPLSEAGRGQAARLAYRFRGQGRTVRAIYSSDLLRAFDTARIVGGGIGLDPICQAAWREMDIGCWSGLTTTEVAARYPAEWDRLRAGEDLPRGGGETFAQFQGRILGIVGRLARRHPGERIVVVTHGGVVRALLLHCRGLDVSKFRHIEKIANTGLSEISYDRNAGARVHYVNDVSHLDGAVGCGEAVDA